MSEVSAAAANAPNPGQKMFSELRVSGHLMTLESGLFCIVQTPGARRAEDGSGLPGVRISLPPGAASRPQAVSITAFRPDGWLSGAADAALVRVSEGPAQILVTIYQIPGGPENAPRLQVLRLTEDTAGAPVTGAAPRRAMPAAVDPRHPMPAVGAAPAAAPGAAPAGGAALPLHGNFEIAAHVQLRGDIGAMFGEWIGDRGSKRWVEGFALSPRGEVAPADIEYQAVLGRGWLSPWVEGGQLCGSRGMALPLLGLRARLRGKARETHRCTYSATFVDGTAIGPVADGEACEAESMAPLEAFQIVVQRREARPGTQAAPAKQAAAAKPLPAAKPSPAKAPAAKPAAKPAARPGRAGKTVPPRRGR